MTTVKTKSVRCCRDELLASLIHLAECCPVEGCNPEECPLYQMRKLKHAARLKWFNELTKDDLDYLAAYHYTCMNKKLAVRSAEEAAFS